MSLKAFHIIFVTLTTLFCLFFGIWNVQQYTQVEASNITLAFALASFAGVLILPVYGYYFLKKLKHVSFL